MYRAILILLFLVFLPLSLTGCAPQGNGGTLQAYREGYAVGRETGYREGLAEGQIIGRQEGIILGFKSGGVAECRAFALLICQLRSCFPWSLDAGLALCAEESLTDVDAVALRKWAELAIKRGGS